MPSSERVQRKDDAEGGTITIDPHVSSMTLLTVHNLGKYYGADLIFQSVSFRVARGEKVALVGVNGAGKSTLLKILAGSISPDMGSVQMVRGGRLSYLAQEVRFDSTRTLWQEMETSLAYLADMQEEIRVLEQRISDTTAPDWDACMQHYGELTTRFELAGGYHMEQRIERTLHGLGFAPSLYHHPVAHLSGGQKTRAALAAALLSDPDLLVLDEPTNHLDMAALEWLELFLKGWHGTLMVISHDRYFLDRVTGRTLELAFGQMEDYPAGYHRYLAMKAERMERRLKDYNAQQEYIARTEEFIRRYKAGQRAKEAKGREKRLNRLKEQQQIARPMEQKGVHLSLKSAVRSGDLVVSFQNLVVGYEQRARDTTTPAPHVLLRADRLELLRGERVALIGPNGCGKTTLLRTLVGERIPLSGKVRLGHNVMPGYFAQGHDGLNMEATVLDEVLRIGTGIDETHARTLLGSMLFSGDDVFKRVGSLSGGERNRVALAQLTLAPGNLLVLDEPTNHLDIDAREALETVLSSYRGSILFVSHDRFFIDALADKLWMVQDGTLIEYRGTYSDYRAEQERIQEEAARNRTQTPSSNRRSSPSSGGEAPEERQRKKRLALLEEEIEQLEATLERMKSELETASTAQDIARIAALGTEYAEHEERLHRCYDDWATLADA